MNKFKPVLKWTSCVVVIMLILLSILRFAFYLHFKPHSSSFPLSAFLMGIRFDLRVVSILGILVLILSSIRPLNPINTTRSSRIWLIFLGFISFIVAIFYITDFFHYEYLEERLNASALNYLENAGISARMVWQTYPIFLPILFILIIIAFTTVCFSLLLKFLRSLPYNKPRRSWIQTTVFSLLLAIGAWGTLSQFPLRWSNAYTLGDHFKAQLALNPIQSFLSSFSFRYSTYDQKRTKDFYPIMSAYLGVDHPNANTLDYSRVIKPAQLFHPPQNMNVIVVICESFSAYKSSMWNNPLNTTPYFNQLCQQGILFDHCFTPSFGTARGVWATITGIPDVESPKTASRNPAIVDQHCLIDDFKGYDKYYFLGGDANWANVRGFLDNNIRGLKVYEQADFKSGRLNVWGISDKNLFLESTKILAGENKPFFAVIQTADNHRPYTIPQEDLGKFKKLNLPKDSLNLYGFASNDEFNAFRYTDFCYQSFMEAAKQTSFFNNTLFVFVGDHGVVGNTGTMFPKSWQEESLVKEHVPLLFYAPSLLPPARNGSICSQTDILPSVCGLLHHSYMNTGMGRNLFDTSLQTDRFRFSTAFINDPDEKKSGIVTDNYYFRKSQETDAIEIESIRSNDPLPPGPQKDSLCSQLKAYTEAYYETARYLLYHNKRK